MNEVENKTKQFDFLQLCRISVLEITAALSGNLNIITETELLKTFSLYELN